ncbi:MAG: hypothetical protein U9Q83_09275, partial [Bacteroidota bacterium]|nr:hypothetical protein [Bacteroidota bacterium]
RTHYADASKVSFDYGPYLLEKKGDFANVGELDKLLDELKGFVTKDSKGISKLRQWISELYKDKNKAKFMMDRIKEINKDKKENNLYKKLELEKYRNLKSIIYNDLIQLHTFKEMYDDNKI